MQAALQSLVKLLPALLVAVGVLVITTWLTYTGHMTSTESLNIYLSLLTIVGATGIAVLVSSVPNTALFSHMTFTVLAMVGMLILVLHNVWGSEELNTILTLVVVGSATGAGVNALTNVLNALPTSNSVNVDSTADTVTLPPPPAGETTILTGVNGPITPVTSEKAS